MADSSHKSPAARENAPRLTSIDAYRGVVMLLMLAEVVRLPAVARALPDSHSMRYAAIELAPTTTSGYATRRTPTASVAA